LASTAEKLKFCQFRGADFAIDYTTPDWPDKVNEITGGVGADIIYDTVGGSITKLAITALAPGDELLFAAVNRFNLESSDLNDDPKTVDKGFALLPLCGRPPCEKIFRSSG
jgi:NADPH2:quinone reductase